MFFVKPLFRAWWPTRFPSLVWLAAGLLMICPIANGQAPSAPRTPHRIATHMTAFGLPFAIEDANNRFVEVQLYVSRDRGQSWQFYGRQPTDARSFPFQSSGDGEYWFAIRTLDRDRQLLPSGDMAPEQIVLIDTQRPALDFRIQTDAAGRVVVRWRAEDENIDPASVQLSYRPLVSPNDAENVWIDVPYRAVTQPQAGVFADQYAWWLSVSSQEVLVRMSIADLAGNQAVEERQIAAPRVIMKSGQLAMSNPIETASEQNVARNDGLPRDPAPTIPSTVDTAMAHYTPNPSGQEYGLPDTPIGLTPVPNSATIPVPQTNPSSADNHVIAWESAPRPGSGTQDHNRQAWPQQPRQAPVLTGQGSTRPQGEALQNPLGHPNAMAAETAQPKFGNADQPSAASSDRLLIPSQLASAPASQQPSVLDQMSPASPSGPQTTSINSRRFRLDYDLGPITPADVARVVLWMTRDRGQTWESHGEDPDNVSPMPVEVEGEGHYGFRIVVHTRAGLVGRTPARGDDADAWIRVDLSPPVAQITSAPYGRDQWAGHLVIQWTAVDEQFRHRPIHLSYAATSDGPWTTIADGLENTGSYPWKPDASVPPRVYLRLDAVDAAGNYTTSITTSPIDLSGVVPKSRITGVEPVR